ncbi:MAG: hypothetical protein ABIW79_02100, partial [Gemmatimonas sp.]
WHLDVQPHRQLERATDASLFSLAGVHFLSYMRMVLLAISARRALRCATSAASILLLLCQTACGDVLGVRNPDSLQEERLSDPSLEAFLINGAIGEFQFAFANYAFASSMLADEAFADHPSNSRELSRHDFTDLDVANEAVYGNLQRARQSADDAVQRVKQMQGANAGSSLNVARALIYGGYTYVLLGEGFCEAPVNLSAPLSSNELLSRAIARFDEGMTVAAAANTGTNAAAAQDLINMARVGAARAALKRGDSPKARVYADAVPESYERWAYYSANSVRENNSLQVAARLSQPWLGVQPAFQGLADVRIPLATARTSLNSHPIFPPLKPSMYSGWTAAGPATPIDVATHIRFASGLEARYIVVEADGPNTAMLAFVNARRAIASKAPLNLSGSALVSEFRMQRAIDFYLTGQRLGDLRRYAAAGTDLFPTGNFPVGPDSYGSMHCFIVPRSEKTGNPHY